MRIKGKTKIIENGRKVVSISGHLLYHVDGCTYCDHHQVSSDPLWVYPEGNDELYARSNDQRVLYRINPDAWMAEEVLTSDGIVRLGTGKDWFVWANSWDKDAGGKTYTLESAGKIVWQITTSHLYITRLGNYALLWYGFGEVKSRCRLIDLSSGSTIWEIDHPGTYIKQVYPYADKVIIVWFAPLGQESKDRVLCVEIPSGKILWENDVARNYQKYGDDKLIYFYVHYWASGNDDEDLYTELNVHTGEVYTRRYPGYNANVFVTTIYKDYLFYGAEKGGAYVGAINLRTYEMVDEVEVDFTPGDFNQIASIGAYGGQLYVEIQTELDHSDIHVFDLDEGE